MFAWMKGHITRMFISDHVTAAKVIVEKFIELLNGPGKKAFQLGVDGAFDAVTNSCVAVMADEARLVRIIETWVPVLESIKLAFDLSKEDLISIGKELEPILNELPPKPSAELVAEMQQHIDAIKSLAK